MSNQSLANIYLDPRNNYITIVTGCQGVGKTYRTLQELRVYASPDARTGRKAKPVLIFDVNDEFTVGNIGINIRTIAYNVKDPNDNGKNFALLQRPEIRRVTTLNPDGTRMSLEEKKKCFIDICQNFRNGAVLFEDLNVYFTNTKKDEIASTLVNVRHRGIDVFMHVQSLSKVTTTMFENSKVIRMHYQLDEIDRYADRVSPFEMMKIAQFIVSAQYHGKGNKRYFLYIDRQEHKILGCSTEEYKAGLAAYIKRYGISDVIANDPAFYLPKLKTA